MSTVTIVFITQIKNSFVVILGKWAMIHNDIINAINFNSTTKQAVNRQYAVNLFCLFG